MGEGISQHQKATVADPSSRWRTLVVIGGLYLVLLLALTWPLVSRMTTHVATGDHPTTMVAHLNLWTLAWNHHWLDSLVSRGGEAVSYWDANNFAPHQGTLAYSEAQFGTSLLSWPLHLARIDHVLAYNIVHLAFMWGGAVAMYLLVARVVEDIQRPDGVPRMWAVPIVPALCGAIYGFNPFVFREFGVLQLLALPFPPIAFLGLYGYFFSRDRTGSWKSGLLAVIGFLATWYTCAYYGLFLSVFAAVFVCFGLLALWRTTKSRMRPLMIRGTLLAGMAGILLLPFAQGMFAVREFMQFQRPPELVEGLSGSLLANVVPDGRSWLWQAFGFSGIRSHFLGLAFLLTCLIGLERSFRFRKSSVASGTVPPSIATFRNLFLMAVVLSLGMTLVTKAIVKDDVFGFLYWLSPYNLLYEFFPGFTGIRSPYRFALFAILFGTVLGGWGLMWVAGKLPRATRCAVVPILAACVASEGLLASLHLEAVPKRAEFSAAYTVIREQADSGNVLEIPMTTGQTAGRTEPDLAAEYMVYSTSHWKPLINGYSGYAPRAYIGLIKATETIDGHNVKGLREVLEAWNVGTVLVHWDRFHSKEVASRWRTLTALDQSPLVRMDDYPSGTLYKVRTEPATQAPAEARVDLWADVCEHATERDRVVLLVGLLGGQGCKLILPHKNPVRYEVSWTSDEGKPGRCSGICKDSLMVVGGGTELIEIDCPMPRQNEPWSVKIEVSFEDQQLVSQGVCEASPGGFVTWRETKREQDA